MMVYDRYRLSLKMLHISFPVLAVFGKKQLRHLIKLSHILYRYLKLFHHQHQISFLYGTPAAVYHPDFFAFCFKKQIKPVCSRYCISIRIIMSLYHYIIVFKQITQLQFSPPDASMHTILFMLSFSVYQTGIS